MQIEENVLKQFTHSDALDCAQRVVAGEKGPSTAPMVWVKVADCHEGGKDIKAISRIKFCTDASAHAKYVACICC